ncbi:MAG: response regulator, partial [bacterium]|nr:response regulator [bacterium]
GKIALERFDSDPFDLVITDLAMPEMDGFELIDALQRRKAMLPIVVFTGLDTRDMMREAMKRGAYDFLAKPVLLEELDVTVRNALENYSTRLAKQRAESDLERLRSLMTEIEEKKLNDEEPLPRLLKGWKPADYAVFRGLGRELQFSEGQEYLWENPGSGGILFVVQGKMSVKRLGRDVILLSPGDSWGASSLLNVNVRSVKLIAETEVRVVRYNVSDALTFFRQHEERLFKLWVINLIFLTSEWLETAFDRIP